MGYDIDLKQISLGQYKNILKTADLLPSRIILKDNAEVIFSILQKQNIPNLHDLMKALNSKQKLHEFSSKNRIDINYLTILVRELKSYRRKPNFFRDIPSLSQTLVTKLEMAGYNNTRQLFGKILTPANRRELAKQLRVQEKVILKLAKLTDLSRIRWVNHTFAYVLYEAEYDTTEKVAQAESQKLYDDIKELNIKQKIYKGHIGLNDMKRCIDSAKDLPLDIKYE